MPLIALTGGIASGKSTIARRLAEHGAVVVDADQIVRADLQELIDLDLEGAPYGYTPMGDDNYDMEGFRFWKTGYWHDFLRGRPYHIR